MQRNFNNLVSVGIPFYHKTKVDEFNTAVKSILNQTLKPDVIYLVQDGPVGGVMTDFLDQLSLSEPSIQLIRIEKKGTAASLNASINRCSTKYYARMDADDISFPNRLYKQIQYLEENPKVDIIGSWAIEFEDEAKIDNGFIKKLPSDYNKLKELFHYRNPLIHPTVVFRKSVFDQIGFYNETYFTDQDLELWSRVLKRKILITNLQEPLLYFRTKNVIKRRSSIPAVIRQIKARYSYNTWSVKLNILKILMIMSRLTPQFMQQYLYNNFRK